jgi:hypothetical protein
MISICHCGYAIFPFFSMIIDQTMGSKLKSITSFLDIQWKEHKNLIEHIETNSLKKDCDQIGLIFNDTYRQVVKK